MSLTAHYALCNKKPPGGSADRPGAFELVLWKCLPCPCYTNISGNAKTGMRIYMDEYIRIGVQDILKRQTDYLKTAKYQPTFEIKESHTVLLSHGFQFIACSFFCL